MNWEVQDMKSGTSFFHKGIAANLLKRCWPLWSCYLALLLFLVPVQLLVGLHAGNYRGMPVELWLRQQILQTGCAMPAISFVVCVITAMAMFSYLYNTRTCGMMNALPVRRETLFSTVWLSGILPLLAADLLTAILTLTVYAGKGNAVDLLTWLGLAAMSNIAFYGFAVFCAMLTGSLYILPLVYAVLGFAAFVFEESVRSLLNAFLYGGNLGGDTFSFLSPLVRIMRRMGVDTQSHDELGRLVWDSVTLSGAGTLAAYCAAGLVFSLFALLIYRRRRMETASDTVAVPVLKPIFVYCMAFGTAAVLSAALWSVFLSQSFRGRPAAVVLTILLLLGAFIGYFAAHMLIRKTLRVFRGNWKGFLITAAVCLVFAIGAESDLTGYEKQLPDPAEIESVHLNMNNAAILREPANLQAAVDLQQRIIDHKAINEAASETWSFGLVYDLKNGTHFSRTYAIGFSEPERMDPGSDFRAAFALNDSVEANLSVYEPSLPVTPENIYQVGVWNDFDGRYYNRDEVNRHPEIPQSLALTAEEAADLWHECIRPDILAGRIHNTWIEDMNGEDTWSGIQISMELRRPGALDDFMMNRNDWGHLYLSVPESATLTLQRLAELGRSSG